MKRRKFLCFIAVFSAFLSYIGANELDTLTIYYADSSVARIYTVLKGTKIQEGLSISYHPNQQIAIEAYFKEGKLDGLYKSNFENDQVFQSIGYINGVEEEIRTTYFKTSKQKPREIYKNGELNGKTMEYDSTGVLRRELNYNMGTLHGVAKLYDERGLIAEEMEFVNGLRHGFHRRYKKGLPILESKFKENQCIENCY